MRADVLVGARSAMTRESASLACPRTLAGRAFDPHTPPTSLVVVKENMMTETVAARLPRNLSPDEIAAARRSRYAFSQGGAVHVAQSSWGYEISGDVACMECGEEESSYEHDARWEHSHLFVSPMIDAKRLEEATAVSPDLAELRAFVLGDEPFAIGDEPVSPLARLEGLVS